MAADRTVARSTGPTRGNTRVMRAAQPPTDARAAGPLAMVQRLQRSVGNRATQAVLQRVSAVARPASAIQTKLTVGRPDDVYEREADAAAERITSGQPVGRISRLPDGGLPQPLQRQSEPEDEEPVQTRGETRPVQRLCPECAEGETQRQADEDEEEPVQTRGSALAVQRLCPACREETQRQTSAEDETLQTKATDGGASIDTDVAARAMARSGAGSPLGSSIQAQMEQGFGADFSDVRIHTGSAANEAAQALNARAFTLGSDIYLARSEHASDTRLVGHELTHVVQQNSKRKALQRFVRCEGQGQCPRRVNGEVSRARSGAMFVGAVSGQHEGLLVANFAIGGGAIKRDLPSNPIWANFWGQMVTNPHIRWEILGFADCHGDDSTNELLRWQRAIAVNNALPQLARNQVRGFRAAPLIDCMASNADEQGRTRNRSVLVRQTTTRHEFPDDTVTVLRPPVACFDGTTVHVRKGGSSESCAAITGNIGAPTPNGTYCIREQGAAQRHRFYRRRSHWYLLEPQFSTTRSRMQLHPGRFSEGCITVTNSACFDRLAAILNRGSTITASGYDGYPPGNSYGVSEPKRTVTCVGYLRVDRRGRGCVLMVPTSGAPEGGS